jgi:uncharacterized OsmC-like protein
VSDLRTIQKPLKDKYRAEPSAASITLSASGIAGDAPIACSVEVGRAIHEAQAHGGVGGAGTGACSGDMLLGALAACAQITGQMVASAMSVPVRKISAVAEGDLDLRGTLGVDREVPVGFQDIRLRFEIDAPDATPDQIESVMAKTQQYCVVLQTLQSPPEISFDWATS